ncbi:60S ribosomal protein L26-like 1 [Cricetulus griseus]|uniref:60S ribosomal protein L26-like 1 n=1 Tax=Cricetulus griseus TaxID=10029 RepID=A0A9J7GCJ4_CRIGR|nr:60S ribosomal protein L26-like 1 [Cricetulus griseus]XP_027280618.1 60S ribosomal protein L26-like 1 [Cricetulus griseus]
MEALRLTGSGLWLCPLHYWERPVPRLDSSRRGRCSASLQQEAEPRIPSASEPRGNVISGPARTAPEPELVGKWWRFLQDPFLDRELALPYLLRRSLQGITGKFYRLVTSDRSISLKRYFNVHSHMLRKTLSSRLSKELRQKYNVPSVPICKDDEVQVVITRLEPD